MFEGVPLSKALRSTELPKDEWDCEYRRIAAAEGKEAADDFLDWQKLMKAAMDTARKLDPPRRDSPPPELWDFDEVTTTAATESDARAAHQSSECSFAVEHVQKSQKMLKPTAIPYYGLVYLAFLNSNGEPLSVQQMYAFVLKVWPAFATATYDWQSSIRNQLVTHRKIFQHAGQIGHNVLYNMNDDGKAEMQSRFYKYMSKNPGALKRGIAQGITWDDLLKGKVEIPLVVHREKKERPKKRTIGDGLCKERTPKEPKKRRSRKEEPPQLLHYSNIDFDFPADQFAPEKDHSEPSSSLERSPLINMQPPKNTYQRQTVSDSPGLHPPAPSANACYQTGQVHQYPGLSPFINTVPFSRQPRNQNNPMNPLYGLPQQQTAYHHNPMHPLYGLPQQQQPTHENTPMYSYYGHPQQQHAPHNNPMHPLYGLPQQQHAPQNIPTDSGYSLSQRQGIVHRPKYYYVVNQQNQQG